jgi:hypothetical protein
MKILIYLKIDVLYFNQFLHNFSNQFFKNLILIRFKGIEANYLHEGSGSPPHMGPYFDNAHELGR